MTPKPLILADGTDAPFNQVVRVFEDTLHVKLGDPTDVKRRVLERKKTVRNLPRHCFIP